MEIIIDANVATGYLRILRTGNTTLSGDPRIVFDNLNKNADQAVFDTGGHIKQEWINSTGYEWVQRKLTQLHQKGGVRLLEINDNCEVLLATLWRIGFPQKSRNSRGENIWYIRSAKIISIEKGLGVIISEDLDFFDPVKKANGVNQRKEPKY